MPWPGRPTGRWLSEQEATRFVADLRVLADVVPDPHLTELVDLRPPVPTPAAFLERLEG